MNPSIYNEASGGGSSIGLHSSFEIDEELMNLLNEIDEPEPEDEEEPETEPEDETEPEGEGPEEEPPARAREPREPRRREPRDLRGRGDDDKLPDDLPEPDDEEEPEGFTRDGNILKRKRKGKQVGKHPRDIIQRAALANRVVRLTYVKLNGERTVRIIEPYSYRVQYPQRTNRVQRWYLFGFDRTKDQLIKSFLVRRVVKAEIGKERFVPRWEVEF